MQAYGLGLLIFIFLGGWFLFNTLKILKQYERGLIFTLGKVSLEHGVKGPGLIVLLPGIQKMVTGEPADRYHGRPVAGRDHQGQRDRESERSGLLPRH